MSICEVNVMDSRYLSYQLGFIVILQRKDREVKLLIGQTVSQRVPNCYITMGKSWIIVLYIHT